MTMATNTDIKDIKTAVESNTKTIVAQSDRIEAIIRGTEANTRAVNDLTQQMRFNFLDVEKKIEAGLDNVEKKLIGLEGKIDTLDARFDERTKGISQRVDGKDLAVRNVSTGLIVATTGGILLAVAKYLFFGTLP
jgi:predicted  nucleic acid-binding Zn-ribbon protein